MGRVTGMEQRGSVFYYRRRVPKDLTAIVGRAVIKETLRERDPVRARHAHAERALVWEGRFARMRHDLRVAAGPVRSGLTDAEITAVGDHHRRTLLSEDDQIRLYGLGGDQTGLPDDQFERHGVMLDYVEEFARDDLAKGRVAGPGRRDTLDLTLAALDVRLDPHSDSYRRAGREILVATIEAMQAARRRQDGDPVRTPEPATAPPVPKPIAPVTVDDLIDGWSREAQPVEKTIYTFTNHLNQFAAFAGQDLSQVDADMVAEWKREILKSFSAKTVGNKIASCKAVFGWAKANRVLRSDPFSDVVAPKTKKGEGKRGYSDDETRLVLTAARGLTGWKRWMPWLLSFTGARIAELAQLDRKDVICRDGVWAFDLNTISETVEDKAKKQLKNAVSKRLVPIHKALIDEGFLAYALLGAGPLFPDIKPDRFGSRGGNASKTNGRWVRETLLITDPRLQPAHGFRHRFKTLCRNARISLEIHDALTGHKTPGVGADYGETVNLEIRAEAMALIPVPADLLGKPIS